MRARPTEWVHSRGLVLYFFLLFLLFRFGLVLFIGGLSRICFFLIVIYIKARPFQNKMNRREDPVGLT